MPSKIQLQRLLALFAAAALLFNFPLQQLWLGRVWAVFVLWALLIACLAWLMERATAESDLDRPAADPVNRDS